MKVTVTHILQPLQSIQLPGGSMEYSTIDGQVQTVQPLMFMNARQGSSMRLSLRINAQNKAGLATLRYRIDTAANSDCILDEISGRVWDFGTTPASTRPKKHEFKKSVEVIEVVELRDTSWFQPARLSIAAYDPEGSAIILVASYWGANLDQWPGHTP